MHSKSAPFSPKEKKKRKGCEFHVQIYCKCTINPSAPEWLEYFYLNTVLQGSETPHRPHSHSDSLQMKQLKPRCTASACVTAHIVDSKWMPPPPTSHTCTAQSMTSSADSAPATKKLLKSDPGCALVASSG